MSDWQPIETAPKDGTVIELTDEIVVIREPIPYFAAKGVGAEVIAHDKEVSVRETPAQVKQLVEGAKR